MTTRYGVDYSFSRPSPDVLRRAGKSFVGRYISRLHPGNVPSGKDLSRAELANLRAAGLDVILFWEGDGGAAKGGRTQGVLDAQAALGRLADLGMTGAVVFFTVDYDDAGPAAASYISGAASILGYDRTGVYGGVKVVRACADGHVCRFLCQTYAWSVGAWDPRVHVRQVKNGQTLAGGTVDLLETYSVDFGQWPRPVPAKPVVVAGPTAHQIHVGVLARAAAAAKAHAAHLAHVLHLRRKP